VDDAPAVKRARTSTALQYETDQAGFLGGILAAGCPDQDGRDLRGSSSRSVTLYMNGFVAGVRYYDKTYKKSVNVLGWTPAKGACTLWSVTARARSWATSPTDRRQD